MHWIRRLPCAGLWLLFTYQMAWAQAPSEPGLPLVQAVLSTVEEDPFIRQQAARVAASRGALLLAQGAFDVQLTATLRQSRDRSLSVDLQREQFGGITEYVTDASFYRFGLQRTFRSGLVISPGLEVIRSSLASGTSTDLTVGQPDFPTGILSRFSILFSQPLLKGRGARATAALEKAEALGVDAAVMLGQYVTSERILVTITRYWQYTAAWKTLAIITASEERARTLLAETETLVQADQRPAADLDQLRADAADKAAARIRADQHLFEAQQNLGLAMGLRQVESARLPPPTDSLPSARFPAFTEALPLQPYLDQAIATRYDLLADHQHSQAARHLRDAAHRNRLHTLNLNASVGYSGIEQGSELHQFFSPLAQNAGGIDFLVSLHFEMPFGNRAARGALAERLAGYERQAIGEADLRRTIETNVEIALQDLMASRAELVQFEVAIGHHRQALENERKKFQQGFSTLFNVILFQDRLTLALTNHIAAQAHFAIAIARLRHEVGMLVPPDPRGASLDLLDFITIPTLDE